MEGSTPCQRKWGEAAPCVGSHVLLHVATLRPRLAAASLLGCLQMDKTVSGGVGSYLLFHMALSLLEQGKGGKGEKKAAPPKDDAAEAAKKAAKVRAQYFATRRKYVHSKYGQ